MPGFGRKNKARVLARRVQRPRIKKSSHILCGKLKNNNHLLAKALSQQKQECESVYSENIRLTSVLQNLTHRANKYHMIVKGVETNNKEVLSMLVSMTKLVTNNILCCREVTQSTNRQTSQSSPLTPRRESTRRLSTKSPTRGVVRPMVSGHTIEKPTINLRRENMQRINNVIDLSMIPEGSPNTSGTHSQSFTATSRPGYDGGRRCRMPERIPVSCVEADDEDGANRSRRETRSSERFSGRLSCGRNSSMTRNHSGHSWIAQIRSPRVSVCDVSQLSQNSHSINVQTLEDSRSGNFNRNLSGLSTMVQNSLQRSSNINSRVSDVSVPETQNVHETIQSKTNSRETSPNRSTKISNKPTRSLEQDPLAGPSWRHDSSAANLATQTSDDDEEEEPTIEIVHRKRALRNMKPLDTQNEEDEEPTIKILRHKRDPRKLDSLEEQDEEEEPTIEIWRRKRAPRKLDSIDMQDEQNKNNTADESMEITECVNSISKVRTKSISELIAKINSLPPSIPTEVSTSENLNASSNKSCDEDEQCGNINRSSKFVTDRRRVYATSDEDDDTIMLQLSGRTKALHTTNEEFRLSEINCEVRPPVAEDESEPEVTTTIQIVPQVACPELPGLAYATTSEDERTVTDGKTTQKNVTFQEEAPRSTKKLGKTQRRKKQHTTSSEESDSDWEQEKKVCKKKTKNSKIAKVGLLKLKESTTKGAKRVTRANQSIIDSSNNLNATQTTSGDSSIEEGGRPRRLKAPTNLKEPSLTTKLRR